MKIDSVGEVIAERTFYIGEEEEDSARIVVIIGKPQRLSGPPEDYFVAYQITGPGIDRLFYACVVDAVQALQLVMKVIGADLQDLSRTYPTLRWEAGCAQDTGFPPCG